MLQRHASCVITSRLLVLQTKRLLLSSTQRRLSVAPSDERRRRCERLREETSRAQYEYHSAVLRLGSPEHHDFWLIAYGRLISTGGALVQQLRSTAASLPTAERHAAEADAEGMEMLVNQWTHSMRKSMVEASA